MLTTLSGQTQTSKFESSKYAYTINIPSGFKQRAATGQHIDYKVVSNDGSSITVNVSQRLPEEIGIDGHSYSREYFNTVLKQLNSRITISKCEKIFIDGKKVFLVYYSDPNEGWNDFKVITANLFVGDNAYLITATAGKQNYITHKDVFSKTIKSIKFGSVSV